MTPYERGYSEVMEKLAVSPQLAMKALQNAMRRAPAKAIMAKGRTPFEMAAGSLQKAPRALQRALPMAKSPNPMSLRTDLYKILQNASGPRGAYAAPGAAWA